MNSNLFFIRPLWQNTGLAILRIITGLLITYHGLEIFDSNKMNDYLTWEVVKSLPAPTFMVFLGKFFELSTGILLVLGLFTRIAALIMAIVMLFICFKIGNGKFYYEDQTPFLFAMLAMVFFFIGPVKWSVDQYIFRSKNKN